MHLLLLQLSLGLDRAQTKWTDFSKKRLKQTSCCTGLPMDQEQPLHLREEGHLLLGCTIITCITCTISSTLSLKSTKCVVYLCH